MRQDDTRTFLSPTTPLQESKHSVLHSKGRPAHFELLYQRDVDLRSVVTGEIVFIALKYSVRHLRASPISGFDTYTL